MAMVALLSSMMMMLLLLVVEVVASFQLSSTSSSLSNPHGQLLLQPSRQQPHYAPLFASTDGDETPELSTTTAFASASESIGEKMFAELDKMRQQFSELTESLTMAKETEEQAIGDVTRLTEEKVNVDANKDSVVSGKKRVLRYVFFIFTSCAHDQNIFLRKYSHSINL